MPDAVTHPTTQDLAAFGLGKLPERAAAAIAAHLESCPACRKIVANIPPDSFLGKVRAARPSVSSLPARTGDNPKLPLIAAAPSSPPKDLPPELAQYSKYRFLRELGRGGMGVVYQAEQTLMGRTVAIKVINPSVLDHPDALPRFQSEVRAAAKLDHPNIVRAHDAEQVGNMHLLVMEYVEGASLADLVAKKGPLSVAYACHYIRQAALGLQHAFEQGMVHRDIKPQNLMVNARGQVKVLDFGLARMRSERKAGGGLTQVDAFMGTPEYVSPEQATDARSADTRADIYSLGCTLFFLLAGRPPFQGDSVVKLIMAQIEKEAPALHEVRADVPAELSAVVARMLAKDPARRFQTPVEVAQALAAFVKPGTKPAAGVALPASGVSSPGTGTVIAADTSKIKAVLREVPAKTPAPEAPVKEAASVFAGLGEPVASAKKKGKPSRKPAKPVAAAALRSSKKKWLLGGGLGLGVLLLALLGMWAGGMFEGKVQVKTKDGILVIEVNEPNPKVLVDGERVTVTWHNGGKKSEIHVNPGTHKVEIQKDGFSVDGKELTFRDGDRVIFTARLLPEKPEKPDERAEAPAPEKTPPPDTNKPDTPRVAAAVDAAQARQLWVENDGYFIKGLGNDWFQKWKDGEKRPNLFSEVQRLEEFIELRHNHAPVTFRLYKDKALIKDERRSNEFEQGSQGKWGNASLAEPTRQLWVNAHGYFIRALGNDWFEKWDDGKRAPNLFTETRRTEEFVELRHYHVPVTYRLYKEKALIKDNRPNGSGEFQQAYEGKWHSITPSSPDPVGFVPLFNGKDLKGWVVDSGDKDAWQVKEGELVARGTEKDDFWTQGYLLSTKDYSDFILRFQFQQVGRKDATSGVAMRAVRGETARDSDPGWSRLPRLLPFHLTVCLGERPDYKQNLLGSLWWSPNSDLVPLLQPDRIPDMRKVGEWNEMELEMRGQSLRFSVNGRDVQNVKLDRTPPPRNPAIGLSRSSGRIGFLKRTGEVRYRKIEIKESPKRTSGKKPMHSVVGTWDATFSDGGRASCKFSPDHTVSGDNGFQGRWDQTGRKITVIDEIKNRWPGAGAKYEGEIDQSGDTVKLTNDGSGIVGTYKRRQ